jgi:Holliday junction resolvase RusA-like endonuclease
MTDALFEAPDPGAPHPGSGLHVGPVGQAGASTGPATVVIDVLGTPISQGSKRHVGNGVMVESSKKLKPWREAVVAAATQATGGELVFDRGVPVHMTVTFYFRRPNSHFGTGANSHTLRDKAPRYPAGRPDRDKILRAVTDALTDAGVWWDDSQVVDGSTRKRFADGRHPGALIELTVAL